MSVAMVYTDELNQSCIKEVKNRLNIKIMDLATSLAEMEQSELHIVHAWDFRGEHLLRIRPRMSSATINQLADQTLDIHKKGFDGLIGNYPLKNLNCRLHFIYGDPAEQIIKKSGKTLYEQGIGMALSAPV